MLASVREWNVLSLSKIETPPQYNQPQSTDRPHCTLHTNPHQASRLRRDKRVELSAKRQRGCSDQHHGSVLRHRYGAPLTLRVFQMEMF